MEDLNKEEQVVLVDEQNEVLGYVGKLEAHTKGLLHRAISVIIFNDKGEMLVQQRAFNKYHWPAISAPIRMTLFKMGSLILEIEN